MEATARQRLLKESLSYLAQLIPQRIKSYLDNEPLRSINQDQFLSPEFRQVLTSLMPALEEYKLTEEELAILLLALAPHLNPQFYDDCIQKALPKAGQFPLLGGVRGLQHRGFLPTGETLLFLLAGDGLEERAKAQQFFGQGSNLNRQRLLCLEPPLSGEPAMSGALTVPQEIVDWLIFGKVNPPTFGMNFPARHLHTLMEWNDLVLNDQTLEQIEELKAWVEHHATFMQKWGMHKKYKPGYRTLFYGPPGTGKTLTATLLGKYTRKPVFRIDLSMIVSKFIGETEKNLANLFDKAENKDWILFFDEADALFGKRTGVRDAHDKYANQEVSYLLQRVEQYAGLVILASNLRKNIDEAFTRRFQSIIQFSLPSAAQRLLLWQKAIPPAVQLDSGLGLEVIAQKYKLSGAAIMNVVQYCCLKVLSNGQQEISRPLVLKGIQREFDKEGKLS